MALLLALSLALAAAGCSPGPGSSGSPAAGGTAPANGPSTGSSTGSAAGSGSGAGPAAGSVGAVNGVITSVKATQLDLATGVYLEPGRPVRVGTGPLSLAIAFRDRVDRTAVESRLQVTGATPTIRWPRADLLQLLFPAGQDGEQVEVRLAAGLPLAGGGQTGAELVWEFLRSRGAGVAFLLNGKPVAWPAAGRSYLNVAGTVELTLAFDKPVDRASIDTALTRAAAAGGARVAVAWNSDQEAVATARGQAGQELRVDLAGARDREDQAVAVGGPPLVLRWAEVTRVYTVPAAGGQPKELRSIPHPVPGARSSPTGRRLAYLEGGATGPMRVWVAELKGDATEPWDTGLAVTDLSRVYWLGDRRLLVADATALWLIDTAARKSERLSSGPVDGIAGSADGRLAAWLQIRQGPAGTLVYDLHYRESSQGATGLQAEVLRKDGPLPATLAPEQLALSADGTMVAIGNTPAPVPGALVFSTDGQTLRELPLTATAREGPLAWSPDGQFLVAGPQVITAADGVLVSPLAGATFAAWGPSGSKLAYSGVSEGKQRVWTLDLGTGKTVALAAGVAAGWASGTQVLVLAP